MLNLREADVTQTRFYQEVLQRGRLEGFQQEGMRQGEANVVSRQLIRRCGNLTSSQIKKVRSLSLDQLEALGDALLDFKHLPDLENWFSSNNLEL